MASVCSDGSCKASFHVFAYYEGHFLNLKKEGKLTLDERSQVIGQTTSLDLFWLHDESLEGADSLASPDILAASIVEDLQVALEQFTAIAEDLGSGMALGGT